MVIYLDMCCLKRPFDDQSQPRIRLESEAVLSVLGLESDEVRIIRSEALALENAQNPVPERASRVSQWLTGRPGTKVDAKALENRTAELIRLGLKNFDALHVASAELAGADVFATVDDRLLGVARRNSNELKVRMSHVVDLAQEVTK